MVVMAARKTSVAMNYGIVCGLDSILSHPVIMED
jgi:hypothetical protein